MDEIKLDERGWYVLCEGIDKTPDGWSGEKGEYVIYQQPSPLGIMINFMDQNGSAAIGGIGYKSINSAKSAFRRLNWGGVKWTTINQPLTKYDIKRLKENEE